MSSNYMIKASNRIRVYPNLSSHHDSQQSFFHAALVCFSVRFCEGAYSQAWCLCEQPIELRYNVFGLHSESAYDRVPWPSGRRWDGRSRDPFCHPVITEAHLATSAASVRIPWRRGLLSPPSLMTSHSLFPHSSVAQCAAENYSEA